MLLVSRLFLEREVLRLFDLLRLSSSRDACRSAAPDTCRGTAARPSTLGAQKPTDVRAPRPTR